MHKSLKIRAILREVMEVSYQASMEVGSNVKEKKEEEEAVGKWEKKLLEERYL